MVFTANTAAAGVLAAATAALPSLGEILAEFDALPLSAYLKQIVQAPPAPSDLIGAAYDHASAIFGPRTASRTAAAIEARPALLTANHHGVDFFAQSVQGNLILSLNPPAGEHSGVLPILAFTNVALSNPTYPRGLLIYDPGALSRDGRPIRCPLFPATERRRPVATTPALSADQVRAGITRIGTLGLDPALAAMARSLLETLYLTPAMLAKPNYLHQAAHLNRLIWKRLFTDPALAPELVCLSAEAVVCHLLAKDLQDSGSLAYRCFFDPFLRRALHETLMGIPGCWESSGQTVDNGGTMFFWALDAKGRIIGLDIKEDRDGGGQLASRHDGGKSFAVAWNPAALSEALLQGRLLPSLYTCFLEIALARGLVCLGGYYQRDYLPRMQAATATALKATGDRETAERVATVATRRYLSGMITAMVRRGQALFPAGPVEIIAGGGLDGDDLARMATLHVDQAHLAGLFDTMADAVAPEARPAGWAEALAKTCAATLADKVVAKMF